MRISDWSSDVVLFRSVERVRGRRHVDLDQRVLVAVFPLDRLLAAKGRAGQELEIGSHVLEHDFFVLGMDVGLHGGTGSAVDKSGILARRGRRRSEEHTSELQSLMRISYAVFCLKKTNTSNIQPGHRIVN